MNIWPDSFEVYYDLTRLTERMYAGYATGVDRVDLHYALLTRARADGWRGWVQRSNGFVPLNADDVDILLGELSQRWLGMGEGGATFDSRQPELWRRESQKALREKLSRCSFSTVLAERGILAALWSRLPCFSHRLLALSGSWEDCSNVIYVNIGHCFRFEVAMQSIPNSMRRIYFLHDIIPLTHLKYQKPTSAAHFKKFCGYIGHPNVDVVVSSQATVNALKGLPQDMQGLLESVASIHVCPLALEDRFMTQRVKVLKWAETDGNEGPVVQSKEQPRHFLSVGTIEPRKNLKLLVEVWEQLIESDQSLPKLIWVGKFGWLFDRALMRRFERLQALGHVELRSGVTDSDLLRLMQSAIALLFPSQVEGWGLPLSEALALQVPVIASRIAVFEEVGQGVPELLELDDVDSWQSMILQYAMPDSMLRAEQIRRMRRYQPLTWTQHFDQLKTIFSRSNVSHITAK